MPRALAFAAISLNLLARSSQPWAFGFEAGDDEEGIPQNGVQLGRSFKGIPGDGFEVRMRPAAFQAVVIQAPPQLLRLAVPAVVPGELDALVAHLADGLEDAQEVLLRRLADGVELDADGDLFPEASGLRRGSPQAIQADQAGPGSDCGGFQEITTRKTFPFKMIHGCLLF
jgi:hypothetical protein